MFGQGQQFAVLPEADVMVQLVPVQVVDLLHLAQTVDPGDLGGGHAGDDVVVRRKDPVQAEAFQHHLVAHHAGIVIHKAVAQVSVDPHHREQPVAQLLFRAAVGGLQAGVVAGLGLRHLDGEVHGLAQVAPGPRDGQGHLVDLAGHQADELELMGAPEPLAAGVRRGGGEVGDVGVVHMHGVLHLGGHVGGEVQVQAVAAGAVGAHHRQRIVGGPGGHGLQLLQRTGQTLLHFGVVEGEAFLLNIHRHQVQRPHALVAQIGLGVFDLQFFVGSNFLPGVDLPVAAHNALLGGERLGHGQHDQRHGHGQHQQHGQQDQQPFAAPGFGSLCFHGQMHSFRMGTDGKTTKSAILGSLGRQGAAAQQ